LKQDGIWIVNVLTEGDVLAMPEIEVEAPLSAIYVEVEPLSSDAGSDRP
jgi:hypothetical protein